MRDEAGELRRRIIHGTLQVWWNEVGKRLKIKDLVEKGCDKSLEEMG